MKYSNSSNPFNDPELDRPFAWEQRWGGPRAAARAAAQAQRERNLREIAASARRREAREAERASKEADADRQKRARESRELAGWEQREEAFMLRQHRLGSVMRVNQGRERAVDVLARNVLVSRAMRGEVGPDGKPVFDLHEGVGAETRTPSDIIDSLPLDHLAALEEDLDKNVKIENEMHHGQYAKYFQALLVLCRDRRNSPSATSGADALPELRDAVRESCAGRKPEDILKELETTRAKIPTDPPYWTQVATCLEVEYARALSMHVHTTLLATLRAHGRDMHRVQPNALTSSSSTPPADPDIDDEEAFDQLMTLASASATTTPRVWNRVRTGIDWNKYNRTHFDHDNPPPRSVFGYKFNIFYGPDLRTAPTYTLTPTDSPDFVILTFVAPPPYATISYRILNRPWDRSHNSGFRNVFQNGVLQLHFNFVRRRYRR